MTAEPVRAVWTPSFGLPECSRQGCSDQYCGVTGRPRFAYVSPTWEGQR